MAGLYGSIMQELSGEIGDMSREIGVDEDTTMAAVGTAVPLMLGAMSRQASTSDGASALFDLLGEEEEEDEGMLGNLASMLKSPLALAAGGAMVGKMFGGRQGPVESGLSSAFGLGGKQTSKMMMALTPVVFKTLRSHKRQNNLDAAGMASLLHGEEKELKAHSPELEGLMGAFDRDDDGGVMDDIAKMGAAVMGVGLVSKMFRGD